MDKKNLKEQKLTFLSRFEKNIISFESLLDEKDNQKYKTINNIYQKIISVKNINYSMENILVNTNEDIINGYIYLYKNKEKNSYKDIIKDKIIPILSQDTILTLSSSDLINDQKEYDFLNTAINDNEKFNSLDDYLKKRGNENVLIVYTFSNTGEAIKLEEIDNYMESIITEINNVIKFKHILDEFYEKEKKTLILKLESDYAKYINFFISNIENYKDQNEIADDSKKSIFAINIKRNFDLEKKTNKVTTVLIRDDKIKQLFIDNINGAELSIKDIKRINIIDFINKDPKKLIIDEMLKLFRENKSEELGTYKEIDTFNFIKEFKSFIEKSDDIIKDIKSIIIRQIDNKAKLIDAVINSRVINQNTIDFITAIITHIKSIFDEKIKSFLMETENNNFFTTIFMLNVNNKEKGDSISETPVNQLNNNYSLDISDTDILNNKLIKTIENEYLKMIRENKRDIKNDNTINIKINYKIPGFLNLYKYIRAYLEKEKLSFFYKKNEAAIRRCPEE